jgi:hypothetical protein
VDLIDLNKELFKVKLVNNSALGGVLGTDLLDSVLSQWNPASDVLLSLGDATLWWREDVDNVVELAHTMSNVAGGPWVANVVLGQCGRLDILLEASILENSQQRGSNLHCRQVLKPLQLVVTGDERLETDTIDSQQNPARLGIEDGLVGGVVGCVGGDSAGGS